VNTIQTEEQQYKEAPLRTAYLRADVSWCGSDYCNCNFADIWAVLKNKVAIHLWRGSLRALWDKN
jgi:hypothetical protein